MLPVKDSRPGRPSGRWSRSRTTSALARSVGGAGAAPLFPHFGSSAVACQTPDERTAAIPATSLALLPPTRLLHRSLLARRGPWDRIPMKYEVPKRKFCSWSACVDPNGRNPPLLVGSPPREAYHDGLAHLLSIDVPRGPRSARTYLRATLSPLAPLDAAVGRGSACSSTREPQRDASFKVATAVALTASP